ncbi:hypothetical protein WJX72_008035 [[Myrmecia] bisecta]|uniref:Uncharacterized protein n=1 Tax=[Myrmecia] bisecta TaxID=41462 RepID=A0AAW1QRR5_9CHLO
MGDVEVCDSLEETLCNWLHKHSSLIVVNFEYVFGCNNFITKITFCEDDQHKGFSSYQRHNKPPDVTTVVEAFCEMATANLKGNRYNTAAMDRREALFSQRRQDVQLATAKLEKVFPEKVVVDEPRMMTELWQAVGDVLDRHVADTSGPAHHEVQRIIANEIHRDARLILVDFEYDVGVRGFEYHTKIVYNDDKVHKRFYYQQGQPQPPDVTKVVEAFCELAPAYLKGDTDAAPGASNSAA